MKKKIFTFLFAMIASMASLNAENIEYVQIGELFYNLSMVSKTAQVTYDRGEHNYSGDIVIPTSVEYESQVYSVTSIGKSAFMSCQQVTTVTIPSTITSIGETAFSGCENLTAITLPNGITTIEATTFSNCIRLTSITIPNSVTSIKHQAFFGCSSLSSVVLPNGLTTIGDGAFWNCTGITSVVIPNSVTSIERKAFQGCSSLTSIDIPSSVTILGGYAFGKCDNLTSVTIPNGITVLDECLLWKCTKLESVTIPSSVTDVKSAVFKECTSLTKIFNYGTNPANAYTNAFDGVDKSSCALYVPKNSINLYKNAPVWRDFYSISAIEDVQALENAEADNVRSAKVIIDGKVYINRGDKTYTLQGQEVK